MEVAKPTSEEPREFIQAKLQESLQHIYDSTRIANDIKNLTTKLESLTNIKNQLSGDTGSTAGLQHMIKTIEDLQKDIETKNTDITLAEEHVITGFQDIWEFLLAKSDSKVSEAKKFMSDTLKKFGLAVTGGLETKMKDIKDHLLNIDEKKMNRSEKAELQASMETFKSRIIDLQKGQIEQLKAATTKQLENLANHFNERLTTADPEAIIQKVQKQVVENLDTKLKQQMLEFQSINKGIASNELNGNINDKIAQSVKEEVKTYLTRDTIKSIISELPEYQVLQSFRPEQAPITDTLQNMIRDIQKDVNSLQVQSHSTRALLNNLLDKNVSPAEKESINAQHAAALNQVEEMQKSIHVMHNNMKMMETVMSVQVKRIEDSASASLSPESRKRPRTEEDLDMIDQSSEYSNKEILARIVDMETKHQKLLDFILQFKDTVLDETFPDRLSAAMKKFQDIMLNHQSFIAFLVDPFTTSKNLRESPSIPKKSSAQDLAALNPAMIDAISVLIKQTAEEISTPLKEKIRVLEDKLNARQQ